MFASVIINIPNSNVDQQFDYNIPDTMQDMIKIGTRVKVPFGAGDRTVMGYVVDFKNETGYSGNIKDIAEVLDVEPLISQHQFALAKYIQRLPRKWNKRHQKERNSPCYCCCY